MSALDITTTHTTTWVPVCAVGSLIPERGVAALIDGHQVAIFLLSSGELHAIDNVDPCSGVGVLSRGIVGDADGEPTVASPLYKQRFALTSGRCLDADVAPLAVHDVEPRDDIVVVRLREGPRGR